MAGVVTSGLFAAPLAGWLRGHVVQVRSPGHGAAGRPTEAAPFQAGQRSAAPRGPVGSGRPRAGCRAPPAELHLRSRRRTWFLS